MNDEARDIVPVSSMVLTPDEALHELQRLQEFIRKVMKEGVDYGSIPGSDQKVLLKPGAEKLAEVYGLAPEIQILSMREDWDAALQNRPALFAYTVKCTLRRKRDGIIAAEGVGSCNSLEVQYRYRKEQCWHRTRPDGEGWEFKTSRDGKKSWWERRVVNPDPADIANTVLKMAKKRALVDAVLSATRSSEIFTQDLDDAEIEVSEQPSPKGKPGNQSKSKRQEPKEEAPEAQVVWVCDDCGGTITPSSSKYTLQEWVDKSRARFGLALCPECIRWRQASNEEVT